MCARFEAAAGRSDAAVTRAERAIEHAERRMPILLPSLLRILLSAGVPPARVRVRATDLVERFDLRPLREFLAEVSVLDHPAALAGSDPLTSREREVVDRAAAGSSNAQIARDLGLSVRTVESHLHHARTRLGMSRHERFVQVGVPAPALAVR